MGLSVQVMSGKILAISLSCRVGTLCQVESWLHFSLSLHLFCNIHIIYTVSKPGSNSGQIKIRNVDLLSSYGVSK